jgi:hypothetical protein
MKEPWVPEPGVQAGQSEMGQVQPTERPKSATGLMLPYAAKKDPDEPRFGHFMRDWAKKDSDEPKLEHTDFMGDSAKKDSDEPKLEHTDFMGERIERFWSLWNSHKNLIDKFVEVAEGKVSKVDDYGDEKWAALPREIERCLVKIAQRQGITEADFRQALKERDPLDRFDSWGFDFTDGKVNWNGRFVITNTESATASQL